MARLLALGWQMSMHDGGRSTIISTALIVNAAQVPPEDDQYVSQRDTTQCAGPSLPSAKSYSTRNNAQA